MTFEVLFTNLEADYSFPIDNPNGSSIIGHNIVATLVNGADLMTTNSYKYIHLDGIDDYIDLGENSDKCLGNVQLCTSGLTLSMWIQPTKVTDKKQW